MSESDGPVKAYKNLDFLNSPEARTIRMVCEYEEPKKRFEEQGITNTIVFFGSARAVPTDTAESRLATMRRALGDKALDSQPQNFRDEYEQCQRLARLSRYYDDARELSRRLTQWGHSRMDGNYVVATGGGPGIMEAANRGAADVVDGRSIGLGISLPFEEGVNRWVTPELAFEFHYFFTRKYWFLYLAKALVVFPGGFGTMDEFFETLTLRQTKKIDKPLPMILFGTQYWNDVINVPKMVEWGTISERDLSLFHITDCVDDAYQFLEGRLGG